MNANAAVIKREVRLKGIVLPAEHGSWGFLFEPLLAGLLVAFSASSVWIALFVIGAFLARQPLKILFTDVRMKRWIEQTSVAFKFLIVFGLLSLAGFVGSVLSAPAAAFVPFLMVAPLGLYQIYCDSSKLSRELIPEVTGAIAISSSITVITLANGWSPVAAYALWAIFAARLISSIIYVRNRLRLEKQKPYSAIAPFFVHLAALLMISAFAVYGLASKLTVMMFLVLLVRSCWGISRYRKRVKAVRIGIWEVIYGTLTALSVVVGWYLAF
jgi:hypothetical protein